MKMMHVALCALSLGLMTGCESSTVREGQYWQRVGASEAAYIQGPKAQQMLNRDISRCVVELRELERLGTLRNAIPTDADGRVLDPDELALRDNDTPEREGYLLAEHGDYHDFEGCMLAGGWERVISVPFDVAERSRRTYLQAHRDYKYNSRFEERRNRPLPQNSGSYGELNQ
jgi:hypothetical protein